MVRRINKVKKVSCLIALLLCVVIGGVYANWAYSKSDDITDKFVELQLGIAGATQEGEDGVYEIETNASFMIYQKEGSDHVAELRIESNDSNAPYLRVKFTPNASASVQIKENGVPTEIAFMTSSPFVYKIDNLGNYSETGTETPVLKFANEANSEFNANVTWIEQKAAGSDEAEYFYVEFDEEALFEQVSLSQEFVLDIYKEYAAFQQALLKAGSIIVKVTDGKNVL